MSQTVISKVKLFMFAWYAHSHESWRRLLEI